MESQSAGPGVLLGILLPSWQIDPIGYAVKVYWIDGSTNTMTLSGRNWSLLHKTTSWCYSLCGNRFTNYPAFAWHYMTYHPLVPRLSKWFPLLLCGPRRAMRPNEHARRRLDTLNGVQWTLTHIQGENSNDDRGSLVLISGIMIISIIRMISYTMGVSARKGFWALFNIPGLTFVHQVIRELTWAKLHRKTHLRPCPTENAKHVEVECGWYRIYPDLAIKQQEDHLQFFSWIFPSWSMVNRLCVILTVGFKPFQTPSCSKKSQVNLPRTASGRHVHGPVLRQSNGCTLWHWMLQLSVTLWWIT